ncbi:MAG: formylglycine-generating enzyme family protein [Oceanobacter sp.]
MPTSKRTAQLSPADVARLLEATPEHCEHLAACLGFSFVKNEAQDALEDEGVESKTPEDEVPEKEPPNELLGLPLPKTRPRLRYWYVSHFQQRVPNEENSANLAQESHDMEVCSERLSKIPLSRSYVFSTSQVNAMFRSHLLFRHQSKSPDIPKVVEALSQSTLPHTLPPLSRILTRPELFVVYERSKHLWPLDVDIHQWLEVLATLVPGTAKNTHYLTALEWDKLPHIPNGSTVMLLSDFGQFNDGNSRADSWDKALAKLGNQCNVIAIHVADPRRLLGIPQASTRAIPQTVAFDTKLVSLAQSALAFCHNPSFDRIRHINLCLGGGLAEELALWNSPQAKPLANCWLLEPDERRNLQQAVTALPDKEREFLVRVIKQFWPQLAPETRFLEQCWLYESGLIAEPDTREIQSLLDSAKADGKSASAMFLRHAWPQLKHATRCQVAPTLKPLFNSMHSLVEGGGLAQQVTGNRLANLSEPLSNYFSVTANGLTFGHQAASRHVLFKTNEPVLIADSLQPPTEGKHWQHGPVSFQTANTEFTLNTLTKPYWAERIWQEGNLIHAAHNSGAIYRLNPEGPTQDTEQETSQWQCLHNPWPWAKATGIDKYGLWASFEIKGVRQTLRFIPPGEFIQGSPEDEPERGDDEVQRHVTLTRGFWLADTTCTQALWQAVMGNNPSHFKGGELPVERVSWQDCQDFFNEINRLAPELGLTFPTEAQWEYACRAGTSTPFNWNSAELNSELANFNGTRPYANNTKSEYRESTVPVTRFTPNDWGLYQMHGNVWEWCADWYGEWQAEPAHDPIQDLTGPSEGDYRSLRGGGWVDFGSWLRSARRSRNEPGGRDYFLGLRVAAGIDPIAPQSAASRAGQANDEK